MVTPAPASVGSNATRILRLASPNPLSPRHAVFSSPDASPCPLVSQPVSVALNFLTPLKGEGGRRSEKEHEVRWDECDDTTPKAIP